MMKPLVIYHDNCADGFGAAFAAWLKIGDEAEYQPMQYGYDLLPDFKDREVYIMDFSWKRKHMDDLFQGARRVVWLDHHKTAFEMWCGGIPESGRHFEGGIHDRPEYANRYIVLDNNKCGAMLAWECFHPDKDAPMLIRHIDDYDRWQFKLPGTKAFNKALWSYAPFDFFDWRRRFIYADGRNKYKEFINEGEAILRAHEQNVQSVVKAAARKCSFVGSAAHEVYEDTSLDGLAANCPPHLASDVGHALATQSGTFGLCWFLDSANKVRCSLRSNGDYDVNAIAKAFGGGGHKNAAGFETDMQTLLGWLK